ncbi:GNAT family N-acetyltransferase [Pengzhenrongella sicca]|uniref:GNAT family N-acetyltransferase n=1 Tax=Pengzhenrongella sicca TaxID=2819238 RepID=A0A8A4ZI37_9MICO|nr:GNAT family N-acetyltransferase [Pengzhenrongella sicca]QTE30186.1 GNAT family N-acetyltransferase [Pengzhenrongella sicca]
MGTLARPHTHRRAVARTGRRSVRPALPNEADVLSVLHHALTWDTFAFGSAITARRAADGAVVLVCEVGDSIAGYLCLGDPLLVRPAPEAPAGPAQPADPATPAEPGVWTLRAIGVAPQFRRTGVATDLWRAALECVPASITHVLGSTRTDLVAAVGWYEARGFGADPAVVPPTAQTPVSELSFRGDVVTLRAQAGTAA